MFFAASEARNTESSAISSGWPNAPGMSRELIFSATAPSTSGGSPTVPHSGVPIGPGAMELTRMPWGASSAARVWEWDYSAALLAL